MDIKVDALIAEIELTRKENVQNLKRIILTKDGQKFIADALKKIEDKVGSNLFCRKMFEEDLAKAYIQAKNEKL